MMRSLVQLKRTNKGTQQAVNGHMNLFNHGGMGRTHGQKVTMVLDFKMFTRTRGSESCVRCKLSEQYHDSEFCRTSMSAVNVKHACHTIHLTGLNYDVKLKTIKSSSA